MVNKPRNKGTAAESIAVSYLQSHGWPWAERRALAGGTDLGDITGCPGLVWEVKNAGAGIRMGEWLAETVIERDNARADHGVLLIKPRGLGEKKVNHWFAVLAGSDFYGIAHKRNVYQVDFYRSEPMTYRQKTLGSDLAALSVQAASRSGNPNLLIPFMVCKPPGSDEQPDDWYYVTHFEKLAFLLRLCGYGTSVMEDTDNE